MSTPTGRYPGARIIQPKLAKPLKRMTREGAARYHQRLARQRSAMIWRRTVISRERNAAIEARLMSSGSIEDLRAKGLV